MNAHAPPRDYRMPLPDAIEAEQALLGSIMRNNQAYWNVAGFLKPEHFGGPREPHHILYSTIGQMIAEGRAANPITVKPYIPAEQMVGDLTFFAYVTRIFAEAVNVVGAYDYGREIIEMWARRQLIGAAQDLDEMARTMPVGMTPEKIIGEISNTLTTIAREGNERAASVQYGVILPNAVTKAAKSSADISSRIPWFLPEITNSLGDIRRGNLVGLMSDSGGGKTSFSLQQCRFAASQGFKSAFFSIEVTDEEAALQAAAQQTHISLGRLDAYTLNTKEASDLDREIDRSMDLPFYIVGFGECTLSDIRIKAEAMVKSHGLDLIMIDHAKMIALPNPKDIFADRINALYRGLKALAKTLNVAIVILIQRNDDWKKRWQSGGTIRPMMGDAYGGSGVKQNLDVWFSLYRPEPLYKELIPQTQRQEKRDELVQKYERSRGKAQIINHKRRRGEPGISPEIRFEAEFTLFASLHQETAPAFEGFEGF